MSVSDNDFIKVIPMQSLIWANNNFLPQEFNITCEVHKKKCITLERTYRSDKTGEKGISLDLSLSFSGTFLLDTNQGTHINYTKILKTRKRKETLYTWFTFPKTVSMRHERRWPKQANCMTRARGYMKTCLWHRNISTCIMILWSCHASLFKVTNFPLNVCLNEAMFTLFELFTLTLQKCGNCTIHTFYSLLFLQIEHVH